MSPDRLRPDGAQPPAAGPVGATGYAIRVRGHLDEHWTTRLGGLALTLDADGTSTLSGPLPDQAALHGVLIALRDIGAQLLDLHTTDGR